MSTIHQELITAIKKSTPKGINAVDLLTDIIPMSKEAAYRRLRGEIPFSLDESVRICKKMNISLDHLIEIKQENMFTFRVNSIFSTFSLDEYHKMMEWAVNVINHLNNDPASYIYAAQNTLPQIFALKYRMISRIRLFKWAYQLNPYSTPKKISELYIPEKIFEAQKEYSEKLESTNLSLLLDSNCMETFINDVKFFATLDMISPEEIQHVKEDLTSILNEMEEITKTCLFPSGKRIQIYISHTVFDAGYTYAQNEDYNICTIHLYGINHISCDNIKMSEYQKLWIESLMRFSTLISGCGEMERTKYFNRQRELINAW